jgi:signal transduction histidine kinase
MTSRRTTTLAALAVAVVGVVAAFGIGAGADLPTGDVTQLVTITVLASIATAVVGRVVLWRFAPRSLRTQAVVVGATASAVVIAGILTAANAMFISTHDRNVLLVVVALAAAASAVAALQLASSFGTDAAVVARITETLGAPDRAAPTERLRIKEMEQLATQLREAEARLDAARERERAMEASRRELVAWISHDLRSPLASIRALAEALEDEIVTEPDDVARYHRSIRIESERLAALVDDLFELSRLHAGAVRTASESIAIGELVADAVTGIQASSEMKGVRVVVDLDGADEAVVPAADVLRIVRNLLDNAVRHTPRGGTVVVEVRSGPGAVTLSVLDECGGIPERDMGRVFDVAFRGDAARRRDAGSGGLGLTIAKGLAEAHAGTIDVRNLGPGCRFEVRIPTTTARG